MAYTNDIARIATDSGVEIRTDQLTRLLYATDASIYQIMPAGVAFPHDARETAAVLKRCAGSGIPVAMRCGGTGLSGGALGEGLVLDLARHTAGIHSLDLGRRTVRVGAGVVLDQLNAFLRPHGLCFGPDVATSSRATFGGMVANDSSGARAPYYGTTIDHVAQLELALADGRTGWTGDAFPDLAQAVECIARPRAEAILGRFPAGLVKRWPGYGVNKYLAPGGDLSKILAGSEGTLAAVCSAELRLVPVPREAGLAVIAFASVAEAMQATVDLEALLPVAIEHLDRPLFDQTRGQPAFAPARALLKLDAAPCEALLLVEFYEEVPARLEGVRARRLGLRTDLFTKPVEMAQIWQFRKSGLSLVTARPGASKPVAGIEDVAVTPDQLPAYQLRLLSVLEPLGVEASFYGHAASGLLHVRPVLDLHQAKDIRTLRIIADAVAEITDEFHGILAAEHGAGIARTAYLERHLGPDLMAATREIKTLFDPGNVLNPGKVVPTGRYVIEGDLRYGDGYAIRPPFAPRLAYRRRDKSFVANLEQCNGCGGCRKQEPVMCPTFLALGEERLSTRGRANVIRAAFDGRLGEPGDALFAPELEDVLAHCLACKACKAECPSGVDLSSLKADILHAQHQARGVPLAARLVGAADLLGRLGCAFAPISNWSLRLPPVRALMEKLLGFARERELPPYASERFDRWFARQPVPAVAPRGEVYLWDDTFARYHEPNVGQAAVAVLAAAGFRVRLLTDRKCCGRPAFSMGLLDAAERLGRHNLHVLAATGNSLPILFLEPSCYAMFKEDYLELGLAGAAEAAERVVLFEDFVWDLLRREPEALAFRSGGQAAIHGHCHAKALGSATLLPDLARQAGAEAVLLKTACCGMAGAYGFLKKNQDLSLRVGALLKAQIDQAPADATLIASGTSCRHQIRHLSQRQPLHMAEFLAARLAVPPASVPPGPVQ
jgi:FAD/FMN-containing dehydrogenase/Fe-S oxidoreductase